MDRLQNIETFVRVAETKNFSEAARQLRVARSVVTNRIQQLEEHVGAPLFHRSTRVVRLTEVGQVYLRDCTELVVRANDLVDQMRDMRGSPAGTLTVHALTGLVLGCFPAVIRELWARVDAGGSFDLSGSPYFAALAKFGFVSGKSSHIDRINTIRFAQGRYNVMLDTHTADGLKVALEHRLPNVPMIVLETAQPAKFEETIREALGTEPVRPADLAGIEKLPQRVVVMAPDVAAIKQFVVDHV
jgi:DNA-binding transcriptional LysR family regulator